MVAGALSTLPSRLLTSFATGLLALMVTACGSADSGRAKSVASPGPVLRAHSLSPGAGGYVHDDGDEDGDDPHQRGPYQNDDDGLLRSYGGRAGAADTRAIATLVKRYYIASTAGDGARACSLLSATLAKGLASQPSGPDHRPGGCATALAQLLSQQHSHLASEDPSTMTVTGVYVKGIQGLATLGFRKSWESEILLQREGPKWKLNALFDGVLT
jgi:hypothetical protein